MTIRLPPGFNPNPSSQIIEKAMENFRRAVLIAHPTANADHVRVLAEEIVKRADILSTQSILRFHDVAQFLLERSQQWVIRDGLALNQIGPSLPKNLTDLGMLKLAEGSANKAGQPLSPQEIAAVRKAKPNIIH